MPPDYRVEKLLQEIGTPYEVSPDGDFRVTVVYGREQRSQLLVVRSATTAIGGLEWRTVGSAGYRIHGDTIPEREANTLLDHNGTVPIGGWVKLRAGEDSIAVFLVQIPADCPVSFFRDVLHGVAATADEMERYLRGDSDRL